MGKTPKSKKVIRDNSHLQPKVLLHRPLSSGVGRIAFPGFSGKSAPPKRRMKLSGTLSRKSSHGKGVITKVYNSSVAEQGKESRIPRMSIVAAESSESITANHQPECILENGKEDIPGTEETKCFKDKSLANGSEPEASILSKSETGDGNENSKEVKESNSIQETIDAESLSTVKLTKEDEAESKKQRSGTPQSRSSTPQRKSGRVRSKHDSSNISTSSSTLTPGLKVLKINMTPVKNVTNGTVEGKSKGENDNSKGKSVKTTDVEIPKSVETSAVKGRAGSDVETADVQSDVIPDGSSRPPTADANAPYLRSLRMVSGRRSLSSNSPSKTLPVSSPGSISASSPQWRKRQTRKKDSLLLKDGSEYQGSESELNSSISSGKRKAERADDPVPSFHAVHIKKAKNEDDDMKLFLSDESEENNHFEKEPEEFLNSSIHSKSSDDVMAELKDLNESSDDQFVESEVMEYAYEAREVESSEKLHEIPSAVNQSSNKRWCIIM